MTIQNNYLRLCWQNSHYCPAWCPVEQSEFGFEYCTTDYYNILEDPQIDCVFVTTRPNLHAKLTIEALKKGKDVFVEKPLALSLAELNEIASTLRENPQRLMVGLNRRFASLIQKANQLLQGVREPLIVHYLINSAPFSKDAMIVDPVEGGGIVKGDWCHLIDLAQFLPPEHLIEIELSHCYIILVITFGILNNA